MTSRRRFLRLASVSASSALLGGCIRPSRLPAPGPVPPSPGISGPDSLKMRAAQHRLLFGFAVTGRDLGSDPAYAALVAEQASILVAENAMKWEALRPSLTGYEFAEADAIVAFAEKHHVKVRGHNLAWHRQLPAWFAGEANEKNAHTLLTSHIETVAGRYAGRMHSWDVVNEAVHVPDGRPDGLRDSPWLKLVGPEYIELAFRAARNADPQALLTYNDYGIESESAGDEQKRIAILAMLHRMKTRNVPIDAVGIQAHIAAGPSYGAGLTKFMTEVRGLGLQIFLTEMDVNDRGLAPDVALRDERVAKAYGSFLDLALTEPAVKAVLTWGVSDRNTWLNYEDARTDHQPSRSLLFDRDYKAKSAFFAARKSIDERARL